MFKNAILEIDQIGTIGMIGLILLVSIFLGIIWWAVTLDKRTVDHIAHLPLGDDNTPTNAGAGRHE